MKTKAFAGLGVCMIAAGLLLTACNTEAKPAKLSVQDAEAVIRESLGEKAGTVALSVELTEITPEDVWEETGYQLFKDGSSLDTYVVADGKAAVLGTGFGGYGVTSVVPYDVSGDGTKDLVYAYSYGSGIHRSVISWMDLESMAEYPVQSAGEDGGFRTYDLILQQEEDSIGVYQIGNGQDRETTTKALLSYPAQKDVQSMKLTQDGTLVRKNDGLYYEATGGD